MEEIDKNILEACSRVSFDHPMDIPTLFPLVQAYFSTNLSSQISEKEFRDFFGNRTVAFDHFFEPLPNKYFPRSKVSSDLPVTHELMLGLGLKPSPSLPRAQVPTTTSMEVSESPEKPEIAALGPPKAKRGRPKAATTPTSTSPPSVDREALAGSIMLPPRLPSTVSFVMPTTIRVSLGPQRQPIETQVIPLKKDLRISLAVDGFLRENSDAKTDSIFGSLVSKFLLQGENPAKLPAPDALATAGAFSKQAVYDGGDFRMAVHSVRNYTAQGRGRSSVRVMGHEMEDFFSLDLLFPHATEFDVAAEPTEWANDAQRFLEEDRALRAGAFRASSSGQITPPPAIALVTPADQPPIATATAPAAVKQEDSYMEEEESQVSVVIDAGEDSEEFEPSPPQKSKKAPTKRGKAATTTTVSAPTPALPPPPAPVGRASRKQADVSETNDPLSEGEGSDDGASGKKASRGKGKRGGAGEKAASAKAGAATKRPGGRGANLAPSPMEEGPMPADNTLLSLSDAAIVCFRLLQKAAKPAEIYDVVSKHGWYKSAGSTPVNSISACITQSIKRGNPSFLRMGPGLYALRSQVASGVVPLPEGKTIEDLEREGMNPTGLTAPPAASPSGVGSAQTAVVAAHGQSSTPKSSGGRSKRKRAAGADESDGEEEQTTTEGRQRPARASTRRAAEASRQKWKEMEDEEEEGKRGGALSATPTTESELDVEISLDLEPVQEPFTPSKLAPPSVLQPIAKQEEQQPKPEEKDSDFEEEEEKEGSDEEWQSSEKQTSKQAAGGGKNKRKKTSSIEVEGEHQQMAEAAATVMNLTVAQKQQKGDTPAIEIKKEEKKKESEESESEEEKERKRKAAEKLAEEIAKLPDARPFDQVPNRKAVLKKVDIRSDDPADQLRRPRGFVVALADGHGGQAAARFFSKYATRRIRQAIIELECHSNPDGSSILRPLSVENPDVQAQIRQRISCIFAELDLEYLTMKRKMFEEYAAKVASGSTKPGEGLPGDDGCTLLVCVVYCDWLITANVGDSRALLLESETSAQNDFRRFVCKFNTTDQSCAHPPTARHIYASGGLFVREDVKTGNVREALVEFPASSSTVRGEFKRLKDCFVRVSDAYVAKYSRPLGMEGRKIKLGASMGDLLYKLDPDRPILSSAPEVGFFELPPPNDFMSDSSSQGSGHKCAQVSWVLVMASDGLWNYQSNGDVAQQNEAVANHLGRWMREMNLQEAAKRLAERQYNPSENFLDDCVCIVVTK